MQPEPSRIIKSPRLERIQSRSSFFRSLLGEIGVLSQLGVQKNWDPGAEARSRALSQQDDVGWIWRCACGYSSMAEPRA